MRTVKVGILGSGFAADMHARSFREIPNVELVAVGSKSKGHAEEFAKRFGIAKAYHGDDAMERVARDPDVEVVDVILPNHLHRDALVWAAENSKDVIVEKPMARDLSEAEDMIEAVKSHGILHGYAENQLFAPQLVRVKEFVDSGALGRILWVRSREAHMGPHSSWFWDPELAGGGVLMDMGCHSAEVGRWFLGGEPREAFCWGATLHHKIKGEDNIIMLVRYDGERIGQSENSWSAHGGEDTRFEVHGSEGVAFVDITRESGIRIFSVAPEKKVGYIVEKAEARKGWMYPTWREHEIFGYLGELRHFVESFANDRMPDENLNDGFRVQKIIDAGYRSMKSGKWEKLS